MAVSKSLRFEVMRRDGFACRYCGGEPPDVKLHVDHVTPVALGGQDVASNLVTSCEDCNQGKGSTPPDAEIVQDVQEMDARRREAMKRAREVEAERQYQETMAIGYVDAEWQRWSMGSSNDEVPRPTSWEDDIRRFHQLGLTTEQMTLAVDIAMKSKAKPRNTWRYFCGVCWNRVRDLQETTEQIMREDD